MRSGDISRRCGFLLFCSGRLKGSPNHQIRTPTQKESIVTSSGHVNITNRQRASTRQMIMYTDGLIIKTAPVDPFNTAAANPGSPVCVSLAVAPQLLSLSLNQLASQSGYLLAVGTCTKYHQSYSH